MTEKNEHGHDCWPAWRYGPNGEAKIFQNAEDVPKGWVDNPKKVGAQPEKVSKKKAAAAAAVAEDDRAATLASIREAGVELSDDATDEEISAALDTLTEGN